MASVPGLLPGDGKRDGIGLLVAVQSFQPVKGRHSRPRSRIEPRSGSMSLLVEVRDATPARPRRERYAVAWARWALASASRRLDAPSVR
jgi:hypothetical protein